MNRYAIAFGSLLLVMVFACDQGSAETKSPATSSAAAAPAAGKPVAAPLDSEQASIVGTTIAIATGEEVEIISVGSFDQDYKSLSGVVAIEGRVAEVYPERGALLLVDYDRMADCESGCCPQAEVPVRLVLEEFNGELPPQDLEVVVVGDLTVKNMGYELVVNEIRHGDEVLLSRVPAKA